MAIKVVMTPQERERYVDSMLALDGISHIKEDKNAAYCPISLTSCPEELKKIVQARQDLLKHALSDVGITAYDPATAPYSPDRDLKTNPSVVYQVDSEKIAGARYFVGHNLLPSSGQGIELEKAKTLNRISVILMDSNIRVSRMQPHRTIYLQYHNFPQQAERFEKVFSLLGEFEPGIGFNNDIPALLGFPERGEPVDLEDVVYNEFPDLQYHYNGKVPILRLKAENPEVFYEAS